MGSYGRRSKADEYGIHPGGPRRVQLRRVGVPQSGLHPNQDALILRCGAVGSVNITIGLPIVFNYLA